MLRLNCECGRVLNYKPELIGKKVRCPGCQTSLELPDPDAEVVELEPVEEEPAPARKPAARRPAPRDDEDDRPRRRPARAAAADEDDEDDRPRRRSRRDDDEEEADERPRRRPARLLDAADDDDRPRRRRRTEDDDEDEAPRRRPRRAVASGGFLPRLAEGLCSQGGFAIMAVLVGAGIAAAVFGFREMRLASGAGAAPRQVTLAELIAGGPGQNNHVQLSGFVPGDNFVYQVTMKKSDRLLNRDKSTLPWKAVYVPLLPPDNAQANAAPPGMPGLPGLPGIRRLNVPNAGPSGPIRVLLLSRKAKNQSELVSLCASGSIQGMIINSISSLESETQKMLQQAYPGTNFSQVMILEAGRAPSSAVFSMAAMAGGAGMIVLALALGGVALIFRPR